MDLNKYILELCSLIRRKHNGVWPQKPTFYNAELKYKFSYSLKQKSKTE